MNFSTTAAFVWSVADLLRGDYKQSDQGKVGVYTFMDLVSIEQRWGTAKIDKVIPQSGRSTDLMREHRTALISAAVTGMIDVREAA